MMISAGWYYLFQLGFYAGPVRRSYRFCDTDITNGYTSR